MIVYDLYGDYGRYMKYAPFVESFFDLSLALQAHAPPPGYFVRLENKSAEDDLYLRKRARMRRWLCCTCQVEESYPSNENEPFKSPKNHADGMFL